MDVSEFTKKNWVDWKYLSDVPDECKSKDVMLGVDEAGRGPVLGPMVYGIAYCPVDKDEELKSLDVADSKTLKLEEREAIFERINASSFVGWGIHILSPITISNAMLSRSKCNLNTLSHDAAIGLIQAALDAGVRVKQVFVDTVGPPEKYQEKLSKLFPGIQVQVSKKADSLFPTVSAASICAKVARDIALKDWQFSEKGTDWQKVEYGSGYPGDPKTKQFLRDHMDPTFGFPTLVRFAWSTASDLLEKEAVLFTWDETEEEAAKSKKRNKRSISDMFGTTSPKRNLARHAFFTSRNVLHVSDF
ncbi:unnamed protein product [Notodromas monacha]|uniref:Ribonuclease n=1 Tax=Notodromas monacha TaxID=399045 RepID=A0A7R9BHK0_9CRUS|nr:unnamed protein product [Notodromas monacha]CAG0914850.1 unnamed protein product [Notodromas monacha]